MSGIVSADVVTWIGLLATVPLAGHMVTSKTRKILAYRKGKNK